MPQPMFRWVLAACVATVVVALCIGMVARASNRVCALKSVELMALKSGESIDWMLMNYGKPDLDESAALDARSLVATRTLTYGQPLVRATYRASVKSGESIPSSDWKLVDLTDATTNAPLEIHEAQRRLSVQSKGYTFCTCD